ncbi:MAG: hypothetical protein A2751_01955 [Candidatus Doudnabacteria bacterium RIFCSPHIGHO2_01_FULL_46_14]|uniref:histidine kinase n=1 Tax=Candidatus Doudnabacteria bacterium RIFCSPHIGHO2_01_FULL_46_14 TaxID=1817824 RepID=A0A1F5NJJ3_9BACT|nr:MAG: hypothetical protein A2751_01955 [Candidatus Doudnabacteria bacterium RIFCSPHIGHO2_01_FULL_46_14]
MARKTAVIVIAVILSLSIVHAWLIFNTRNYSSKTLLIVLAAAAMLTGLVFVIVRLKNLNRRMAELLQENYEVGKILVRRDMELTDANTRLTALDQSKSEFVSIAAHQLRTPLTGIRWTFNALLDRELGELNPEQYKAVESGLKSSVRMIDLVNDLLNVARIEEGKFGLQLKKLSFVRFVEPIVERLNRFAEEKGVKFISTISPALPVMEMDEEKMGIAIDNILDNAIKYTSPGGTVTIDASPTQAGFKVVVTDTGIGIPREQIDHIFNKFFRADNALRFQTSGNGLGLYVVKNIIEGHGGTINVESREGHGTTVAINLPAKEKIIAPGSDPAHVI